MDGSTLVSIERWPQGTRKQPIVFSPSRGLKGSAAVVCYFPGTRGNKVWISQNNCIVEESLKNLAQKSSRSEGGGKEIFLVCWPWKIRDIFYHFAGGAEVFCSETEDVYKRQTYVYGLRNE